MRFPYEHIKLLQRRVDFLKSREHQNSYDLAEIGSLEWALANLSAEAEKQEPHSWYSAQEDEWMTNKIRKEHERLNSYTHKVGKFDLALYTHPQPKRECDMGVMCIECPDAQPKREWVGLTVDEMAICIDEPAWDLVLRKAEQILKEKNT